MRRLTDDRSGNDVVSRRPDQRRSGRERPRVVALLIGALLAVSVTALIPVPTVDRPVGAGAAPAPRTPTAVQDPNPTGGGAVGPISLGHWSTPAIGDRRPVAPDGCRHPWRRPVDAVVTDPYRPPTGRYGPGNRGIEYGTEVGDPVIAVDAGQVVFAGPVAGAPVVVVDHGGGLRSSYVRLVEVEVARGEVVTAGQLVARSGRFFHLGARRDGAYLDPSDLLERTCVVVRLVPIPP